MNTNSILARLRVSTRFWVFLVLLLGGCGPAWGPRIVIAWRSPKSGVTEGTPLVYQSIRIGEVQNIETTMQTLTVHARLYRKYAFYVTKECTFLVKTNPDDKRTFIDVRPLNKDAPPAAEGSVFAGADSELGATVAGMVTDWKKTAVLVAVGIGVILLLVFLSKLFLKLWVLVACLMAGAAGANYLAPYLTPFLAGKLPADLRADLVAYVVGFLCGYLGACLILSILKQPLRTLRS